MTLLETVARADNIKLKHQFWYKGEYFVEIDEARQQIRSAANE